MTIVEIPRQTDALKPADTAKPEPAKRPSCEPQSALQDVTAPLRRLQAARNRSLFVLLSHGIDDETYGEVLRWRQELDEAGKSGKLDLLLHSPGGDLNECYRLARLLARHANDWEAPVPQIAASGATLISLGSSNIVMAECAQLGPIDPQVISKRNEKIFASERQSPLEAFQAVKYLREFGLTSLDVTMKFLIERLAAPRKALETASSFASHLAQPILSKIEPYDLGSFALDSNLAMGYCQRVANPADTLKKSQRGVRYRDLVEKYPAHEFIADFEEAVALGFTVTEPAPEIDAIFDELREAFGLIHEYIGFVPKEEGA